MTATPPDPEITELSRNGDLTGGVSVVMVTYWTGPVLYSAIESVLALSQKDVIEVIVVDNGNPPVVTQELARQSDEESRLTLISGHGNVGFARGCNIGASRARGRYLLLLNPDCCLTPGAIPALLAEAKLPDDDWMMGCRVLNPDGSDQRGSRRALLTPFTALVETLRVDRLAPSLLRRYRLNYHENPVPEETTRVPVISGACMMLPTATYQAVGGMDEGYFLHVDDLDLCLRLHRAGIPVYFSPHVEAIHYAGSSRANPVQIEWHKMRGFLRYFLIHFNNIRWLPLLAPLAIGILVRFGIKVVQSLLLTAWKKRLKANDTRD